MSPAHLDFLNPFSSDSAQRLLILDSRGDVLECSENACRIARLTHPKGLACRKLLLQDAPDDLEKRIDDVIRTSSASTIRVQNTITKRWAEISLLPFPAGPNGEKRIACIVADVTSQVEEHKHQKRLLEIMDNCTDVISTSTPQQTITYFNASGYKLLGLEKGSDPSAYKIADIHPDWAIRLIQETGIPEAIENGIWIGETAVLHQNGKEIPVSQTIIAHRGKDNELDYLSTVIRDLAVFKHAESKIIASEARFRNMFETIPSGIAIYRAVDNGDDFVITNMNPAGCHFCNVRRREVIGKRLRTLFPTAHKIGLLEAFRRVWHTGVAEEVPLGLYADDRISFWVENRVFRMPDNSIVAIFNDKTAQRQAEEESLRARERLSTAIECSSAGILIVDASTHTIDFANNAALLLFGMAKEDICGHPLASRFGKMTYQSLDGTDIAKEDWPLTKTLITGKRITNMMTTLIRPDGDRKSLLINTAPFINEQGKISGCIGIFLDMTEQVKLEAEVRQNERRMRALVDASQEAVFILRDDELILANNAALRIFGYDNMTELMQQDIVRILCADRPQSLIEHLHSESTQSLETSALRKDGTRMPVAIRAKSMPYQGQPAWAITALDLRERKRMEEELLQSEKMRAIGQLAGGVAHDFNNILGGISGAAEMVGILDRENKLLDKQKNSLNLILSLCEQAAGLTQQLLTFSRRKKSDQIVLDMSDLLHTTFAMLEHLIGKTITLKVEIEEGLPSIIADAHQLQNALINLSLNARDAMPEGGVLRFRLKKVFEPDLPDEMIICPATGNQFLLLEIIDTGTGIPHSEWEKIFEPFYTTKEVGKGTGLGLSSVYGTMRDVSGGIALTSTEGQGTTFLLYFPINRRPVSGRFRAIHNTENTTTAAPVRPQKPFAAGIRILIIDDEPAMLENTGLLVTELGATTDTAENGALGVQKFELAPESFSLIILDMLMPEMNGKSVIGMIRKIRADIPVLFISGNPESEQRSILSDYPNTAFLQKPFHMSDLSQQISALLTKPEADNHESF